MFQGFRTILVALTAVLAVGLSSTARADSGTVRISFIKAGWVIGGSVGSGTMTFQGRTYPLSIGGLSYGLTFGGSQTELHGRVTNIFRPSDIEGRSAASERPADRIDGQSRPRRHGAHAEVGLRRSIRNSPRRPEVLVEGEPRGMTGIG